MEIWKSVSGMLRVEFTGANPENTFDIITKAKIPISHVLQIDELTYQILIQRRDYKRMSEILLRQGNRMRIIRKQGLYWSVKNFCHRPVLLCVFLFLLCSSIYLPSRILFISVEGNTTIPDRLILTAAEECGIRFAASRKLVRSEQVKNALLSAVPQLQWAGINTTGCSAVISVRERAAEDMPVEENIISNLVADRDGYILSATVTNGTPHVSVGDAVTKGQLLISGYTDCGICIRAARAEGEVIAQTNRKITALMPNTYHRKESTGQKNYGVSLLIGKKRINLWKDSRIFHAGCGRMYEEYYVSLPGGFQLPLAICVDRYEAYQLQKTEVPQEDALQQLQKFSEGYLLQQMIAGQIVQKQQQLSCPGNLFQLESSYTCTEMIGKERREQIGVINGKRN